MQRFPALRVLEMQDMNPDREYSRRRMRHYFESSLEQCTGIEMFVATKVEPSDILSSIAER